MTPGSFSASEVSILRILAWAWGLCSIQPKRMPSGSMSDGYLALPEALARPSSRFTSVLIRRGCSGQFAMAQAPPFIDLAASRAAWKTPMYVPQRQMLPSSPSLTSSIVGSRPGFDSSQAWQAVTKPGVQ